MTSRVLLCLLLLTATLGAQAAKPAVPAAVQRQHMLDMFARAYYPGRSGQIMIVPKRGHYFLDTDPLYHFMHGSPYDYDTHVPLLFHGGPFIRKGTSFEPARQQDIVPTLAQLIGISPPATVTGHVLPGVMASGAARPRLVVVMVLDAMRADYFTKYKASMPTLSRLRAEGAWFDNTHVDYLPTATSVGHATIGTGTDPRIHGQVANNVFNKVTGKSQPAYDGLDPRELMAMTLADVWNIATDGRAIIIGQGGAIRATAGLVGHGACQINGRKVIAASYSTADAGWETNPQCYTLSPALKAFNGKAVWEAAGGQWMGHDITSPTKFRASTLFQRFETDALLAVLEAEPIGADAVTDLVFANNKATDYVAHDYGPDSPEMKEEIGEIDRQIARIVELMNRKAGPNGAVLVITADHGMPPEPPAGGRHFIDEVTASIHAKFDPVDKKLVQYFGDAANAQLSVDEHRLEALKITMKDVRDFLAAQDYMAAVFTEDEVREAARKLPR